MAGKIAQIWEAIAACFKASDRPLTMTQILAWIGNSYPDAGFHPATVKTQIYGSCANVPSAFIYRKDTPKILIFDKSSRTYRLRDSSDVDAELNPSVTTTLSETESEGLGVEEVEKGSTFALEAHLRDYLAINLHELEKGLALWSLSPPSVEYQIDGRRIDILARDKHGIPVVIELKLDRGYDKVVGQALLYQALIANKINEPRVRIILVANDISYELKMACSRLVDVDLFEYAITMQIERVSSIVPGGEV